MPNIALNTEEIYSYADELKSLTQDLEGTLNDIQSIIDNIPSGWKGENAEIYAEKLTTSRNNVLKPLINYFILTADTLKKTGSTVAETQSNIKQKISNLGMIATSASGALGGNFVSEKSLTKSVWDDTDNLSYKDHGDGTYQVMRDGTVIGYTTEDNIITEGTIETRKLYESENSNYKQNLENSKPPIGGIEYTIDHTDASFHMSDAKPELNTTQYDANGFKKNNLDNITTKGYPSSIDNSTQPKTTLNDYINDGYKKLDSKMGDLNFTSDVGPRRNAPIDVYIKGNHTIRVNAETGEVLR